MVAVVVVAAAAAAVVVVVVVVVTGRKGGRGEGVGVGVVLEAVIVMEMLSIKVMINPIVVEELKKKSKINVTHNFETGTCKVECKYNSKLVSLR